MKYISIAAYAAILSASTYAANIDIGLGVETSIVTLEGTRALGTLETINDYDDEAPVGNLAPSLNAVFASKNVFALRLSGSIDVSDNLTIEAGLIANSGKLKTRNARSGVFVEGTTNTNGVFLYKEDISTTIQPTTGLTMKVMLDLNNFVKVGPEVRYQKFETTQSGAILTQEVDTPAGYTAGEQLLGDDLLLSADASKNPIKEDKVTTDETLFGMAISSTVTDNIALQAGVLTGKVKQHVVEITSNLNDFNDQLTGGTSGKAKFNLETSKPKMSLYYAGMSVNF